MAASSVLANQARPRPALPPTRQRAAPSRRPRIFPAPSSDPVLAAVDVLDELVAAIVRKHHGKVPSGFFDWVADEMTPYLEARVLVSQDSRGRLVGSPQRATRDWVTEVCQRRLEQKMLGAASLPVCDIPPGAGKSR
ncbi:hypothetical protein [Polaromonas sp.]|uniref:hypothetical protein n=1 Tax=Polaromonas sp. TaxID=1869339 RepID=UPI003266480C